MACLDDLPNQIQRNKARYHSYKELIAVVEYDENELCSYKNILVKTVNRERVIQHMHAHNLLVREYYSPPLHTKQTPYKTVSQPCPNADRLHNDYLLMPCGEFVSLDDIPYIVKRFEEAQHYEN